MTSSLSGFRALSVLLFAPLVLAAAERPRLAVLTDIGGDPDDQQSMIRLMHYANEFELELLVATAIRTRNAPNGPTTRPDLIRQIVDAYGEVLPNLRRHASGWPQVDVLRARIVSGNPRYGRAQIGEGHDTAATRALIARLDAGTSERPLNITLWGGQTDLAQALWRVKQERGAAGLVALVRQFRVYDVADQDGVADWMRTEFPGMFYILAKAPAGRAKEEATFRGMYLTGDESLTSRAWVEEHVRGRGPLGALYPVKTYTAPNPHTCLKEGDAPSWLFFLPLGGNDPRDPSKPGWGGQYERQPDGWFRDLPAKPRFDPRETVSRWRPDFQRDFARRAAWCLPNTVVSSGIQPPAGPRAAAPKWQQSVIDQAVEAKLVKFSSGLKWENNILVTSAAMYFLALASHFDPEVKSTSGIKVSDRFLEHIRNMIAGGNEPGCLGALGGWVDNSAAQALALARHTSAIWEKLSAEEKARCNFVMQALAVVGNYMQNAENSPKSDMSQVKLGAKTVNPNFQEGYVGIMSAAFIYFGGAAKTDRILAEFKYDDYIAAMNLYGFTNMKKNYTAAGRSLLEVGGKDGLGGTVHGAKIPFTYRDILTGERVFYEPFLIFRSLASKMYLHTVQSRLVGRKTGETYIADQTTSPFEGRVGMCFEFKAVDAEGFRSSATYVFHGWRNSVATRATIQALGYWGTSEDHQDVERRMNVGSEDFIYKLVHGWRGFKHGAPEGPTTEKTRAVGLAYRFSKEIWQTFLSNADGQRPAGRPPASPSRL